MALTFDDGPTPHLTPALLTVLAQFEITATFFLVGQQAIAHPALVRRIANEGHTIGQHGMAHRDAWRMGARALTEDLEAASQSLSDLTGQRPPWMRPPFGHLTPAMLRWCRTHQQQVALWDVMPGDFLPDRTASQLAATIQERVRPGSIIVLHDNDQGPVQRTLLPTLKTALPALLADGWTFAAL